MAGRPEKLSFQDAAFLRMESAERPFHVAGLMTLKRPAGAPAGFVRKLVRECRRLNELWPIFDRKLAHPTSMSNPAWVKAEDYDPAYHVMHYALPAPGRMQDLLEIVTRVHERMLDRRRPLWEIHVIEGLKGGRFALYCKVHHALVDGVGALQMVEALFSTDPGDRIDFRRAGPRARKASERMSLGRRLGQSTRQLRKHYDALPQIASVLGHMGLDTLLGKKDTPPLPFTAPRTLFNTEVNARRAIILAELPLAAMKKLAAPLGGTVNDALIAVCGGALRDYLASQSALPTQTLEAGVPMAIKTGDAPQGNQVGFMICPFFTDETDALKRLKRVIKVTRQAKAEYRGMSTTAAQDMANALMMPTLLLTLSGNASRVRPALNVIVSNVPGGREQLYLEGAPLERLYPLSVVTDGVALNITVVSYLGKLCVAITSCPSAQPDIETLGKLLKDNYSKLRAASQRSAT